MLQRPRRARLIAAVGAQLALASVLAASAGACPISPAAVAAALHMSSGEELTILLTPGPAWANIGACDIVTWSGKRPLSPAQIKAATAAGTFAAVEISTWAPATVLSLGGSELTPYRTTLKTVKEESRNEIVKKLHGQRFSPREVGAHAVGWKAVTSELRVARGVWWEQKSLKIIEIRVGEGRKHSAADGLSRIASTAVRAFGL